MECCVDRLRPPPKAEISQFAEGATSELTPGRFDRTMPRHEPWVVAHAQEKGKSMPVIGLLGSRTAR